VWDEVTREAALFDHRHSTRRPIFDLNRPRTSSQLKHLFITHTHADHIAALEPIRSRLPKVKLHSSAKNCARGPANRANDLLNSSSRQPAHHERDTPGHAEDGVTYVVGNWPEDAPSVAVVGRRRDFRRVNGLVPNNWPIWRNKKSATRFSRCRRTR